MTFHEEIEVEQSPQSVFRFASDFRNLPKWDPSIVKVEQTSPGPLGLGSTFAVSLRFLGMPTTLSYVVESYDAPRTAVLRATSATTTAVDTVSVEPTARGARLTWHAEITLHGVLGWFDPIARWLFAGSVREAVSKLAACLAALPKPVRRSSQRAAPTSRRRVASA